MPGRGYEVPSIHKMLLRKGYWGLEGNDAAVRGFRQHVYPEDNRLADKLGLSRGQRVLFIAGYLGDWPHALAEQGVRVHYTDGSKEIVDFVKKKFRGNTKIEHFTQADAVEWPEGEFNRLVSFEPTPLWNGALPLALLRSLAQTEGSTIVHPHPNPAEKEGEYAFADISSHFLGNYGAKSRVRTVGVKAHVFRQHHQGRGEYSTANEVPHHVFEMDAPSAKEGRRKAQIDFALLHALVGHKGAVDLVEIAKHPALAGYKPTPQDLTNAFERLHKLGGFVHQSVRERVEVKR